MDPARSRDSKADLLIKFCVDALVNSVGLLTAGLNGLVDGVGREVFDPKMPEEFRDMVPLVARGIPRRDGRVPARVRPLVARDFAPDVVSPVACWKSGKPSAFGDSGIVSRNGVEFPEVGGHHS
jgi:hypothetical protein